MEHTQLTAWDKFWRGTSRAAQWMGSQFASFFATFWLYIILWGVWSLAFAVLLYIDGIFSRSLAPASVNPLSFQAMGWAYRFFAGSFLMASARCIAKGVPGAKTFKYLGTFASVIVCLHAFGFGFEALSDRRDDALAVREVVQIAESNNSELIDTLTARKAQIDTDTDKAVVALNTEITQYITDGRNNDHLADDSRARRTALQDQAITDKRAIDDQIMQLVTSGAQSRTDAVEIRADSTAWHPLFVGMAQLTTWTKEPTDWAIYICAVVFIVFWVLLAESLVIFLPERIYIMHMHDAAAARGTVLRDKSESHVRGAETRKRNNRRTRKIENQAEFYSPMWARAVKLAKTTKYTAEGIANTAFKGHNIEMAIEVLKRAGIATDEDIRLVKRMDENLPALPDQNHVDVLNGNPHIEGDVDDVDDDTSSTVAY